MERVRHLDGKNIYSSLGKAPTVDSALELAPFPVGVKLMGIVMGERTKFPIS